MKEQKKTKHFFFATRLAYSSQVLLSPPATAVLNVYTTGGGTKLVLSRGALLREASPATVVTS